jgi:hypothetical protein
VSTVVTRAVTNYLRADLTDLQSDLAPGVALSVPTIPLQDIQIGQITWLSPGRAVGVDVHASARSGVALALHYTVSLIRGTQAGDRWFLGGIDSTPTSLGGP